MAFSFNSTSNKFTGTFDGHVFTFEPGKAVKWDGKGTPKDGKAAKAFAELFEKTLAGGSLKDGEISAMEQVLNDLSGKNADAHDILKSARDAFSVAGEQKKLVVNKAVTDTKAFTGHIVREPNAVNLLTEAEREVVFKETKMMKKGYALASRVQDASKSLEDALNAGTLTKKSARETLVKFGPEVADHIHPDLLKEINTGKAGSMVDGVITQAVKGVDLKAEAGEVRGNIAHLEKKVGGILDEVAAKHKALYPQKGQGKPPFGATKIKLEAEYKQQLAELKGAVDKHPDYKAYLNKTFQKHTHVETLSGIPEVKSLMGDVDKAKASHATTVSTSKVTGTAEKAAKDGRGLWAKVSEFKVTEGKLADVMKKDGITKAAAIEKVGAVGKFRTGKALIAGGVVAAAVAGVSMLGGRGKHAEAEIGRREQGQGQAAALA